MGTNNVDITPVFSFRIISENAGLHVCELPFNK